MGIATILRKESVAQNIAGPIERFSVAMIAYFERYPYVCFSIFVRRRCWLFMLAQFPMFELQAGGAAPQLKGNGR